MKSRRIGFLVLLASTACGCAASPEANVSERLVAPSGATLSERLESESLNGVEPFNSDAVREAASKGAAAAGELTRTIQGKPDHRSFLALIALRRVSAPDYAALPSSIRAKVLVDSLRSHHTFNAWGMPGRAWVEPARMLVDLGRDASVDLASLLDDARPAPHWGSADATISREERLRVKDYAGALLAAATRQPYAHDADPAIRDERIRTLHY